MLQLMSVPMHFAPRMWRLGKETCMIRPENIINYLLVSGWTEFHLKKAK